MEVLFREYITTFAFWGDFAPSKLKRLLGEKYDISVFIDLREWFFDETKQPLIEQILVENKTKMELLKENNTSVFEDQQQKFKYKIPSVESLSTYIGMFDES